MGWDGWDISQTTTTTRAPLAVLKIAVTHHHDQHLHPHHNPDQNYHLQLKRQMRTQRDELGDTIWQITTSIPVENCLHHHNWHCHCHTKLSTLLTRVVVAN